MYGKNSVHSSFDIHGDDRPCHRSIPSRYPFHRATFHVTCLDPMEHRRSRSNQNGERLHHTKQGQMDSRMMHVYGATALRVCVCVCVSGIPFLWDKTKIMISLGSDTYDKRMMKGSSRSNPWVPWRPGPMECTKETMDATSIHK